ncbi:MAG: peptidoglycan-binding protein [Bradyrhizobium sp.]|uniref:peptidoglycan-binding domain-containing protein n=1 Tax=Bradyrhizobium sp. TaxID=376 RepID=UPI001DB08B45|nr:peptidoglycan-binding domain-containing protein [Bradyrhizobium sp.]MBV9559453.1 peptidoglycan-binding protein [Bradyrhizobium sp.]
MPRRATREAGSQRRRRRAAAAAEEASERGLVLRVLLYSPRDLFAGALALAAACAIITNAVFLQSGPHPAPMFHAMLALPQTLMPKPRPTEADVASIEPKPADAGNPMRPPATTSSVNGAPSQAMARVPAPLPPLAQLSGTRRVAAVQRVLTEYGYGQLKPTGMIGPDTQAAIQRFERDRKLPVDGQVSDRLVRELIAVVGQ